MNENFFMSKAVALAAKGKFNTKPGVNVGSIIVKNQKIIGQGYYEGYGGPHAEINAINDVKKKYKKNFLSQLSGSEIRRRRECLKCGERWTTFEVGELVMPKIIKQDKSRVPFDETKIREGIARSLEKRPVSDAQFQSLIESIKKEIRDFGEREIESKQVGETVMRHLKKLDEVAFVRFASVYRSFQDPNEFSEEVKKLSDE